jgi:hypothetical protein
LGIISIRLSTQGGYVKKIITALILATFIAGCASTNKENKPISSSFIGGDLKVTYDKNGEFESISSTATAKVNSTLPNARDEAVTLATVKARRQIAEFIKTEVKSQRFIETISNSVQESNVENAAPDTKENNRIAYTIRDTITQNSNAILQGSILEKESFDENLNTIIVTVRVSKKDGVVLQGLKKAMGQ